MSSTKLSSSSEGFDVLVQTFDSCLYLYYNYESIHKKIPRAGLLIISRLK